MTSESYQVTKENEVEIPKVILPKPEDDIIPLSSYIKDARNRWYIHTVELKEVWDVHVNMFNTVKPHALNAHEYVVKRYQEMMSKD